MAKQQAVLQTSQAHLKRILPLAAANAVGQRDKDNAIGTVQSAEAQAQVRKAELGPGFHEDRFPQRTADSRKGTLELFQLRFQNGIISEVDLNQAESEYEDALARLPDIERAIGQTENALSVLLGRNPGPIPRGLPLDALILPAVPAGVPSELLERRPDIRRAEQALIAANARIGVANCTFRRSR
jgi:hypothetical protein